MGAEPIIAPSARRHGVSDEDILHAYANPIRVFELDEGLTMLIGGNAAAVLARDRSRRGDLGPRRRPRHASPREIREVMLMPRTVQDILDHGDELAKRFEDYAPTPDDERDPESFVALHRAVVSRAEAERSITQAVKEAREHGYSWATIGSVVGTSGEAARQRYGVTQKA